MYVYTCEQMLLSALSEKPLFLVNCLEYRDLRLLKLLMKSENWLFSLKQHIYTTLSIYVMYENKKLKAQRTFRKEARKNVKLKRWKGLQNTIFWAK